MDVYALDSGSAEKFVMSAVPKMIIQIVISEILFAYFYLDDFGLEELDNKVYWLKKDLKLDLSLKNTLYQG